MKTLFFLVSTPLGTLYSKPHSSDIKQNKKDIPNNREKSNKKVGGQVGHKGHCLSKKDVEDKINKKEYKHEVINVG